MEKLIEQFSFGLFFWQLLLFVGLIFLLKKFAWKPILNAVNDREEGIKDALSAAEEAKKEMENLQASNDKLLKEARAEREAMLKEARAMKDKIVAAAKDEAQVEAGKLVAQAQANIQAEKNAALADIKTQVASLSVAIAEKVVKQELDNKDKQLNLVDGLLKEVTLS
jgi:F-type H+-transporting ATPase subunit b